MKRLWAVLLLVTMMTGSVSVGIAHAAEGHVSWPRQMVQHAGGDLRHSFWGMPLIFFLGGAGVTASLSGLDDTITQKVSGHNYLGKWNTIANYAGAAYTVDGAATLTYVGGLISKNEDWRRTGEALVEALVLTEGITAGLKYAVNRQRPNGGDRSFPSGHAARTFAAASALTTLYGWWGVPALVAAGVISASRVTSNNHYLTDVMFGAVLGATIGYGTAQFHKTHRQLLFTVVPTTFPEGGAGLQIAGTW